MENKNTDATVEEDVVRVIEQDGDTPKMVEPHKMEKNPLPADEDLDVTIVTGETSMNSTEVKKASNASGSKSLGTVIVSDTGKSSAAKSSVAKDKKEFHSASVKAAKDGKEAKDAKPAKNKAVKEAKPAKDSKPQKTSRRSGVSSDIKETGQFGKGHTTTKKSVGAYIADDFKELVAWCKKNYAKAIPIGIGIILVIVVAIILINNAIVAKTEADLASQNNAYTDVSVDKTQSPVEENAYDFVNQFVNKYYGACAEGDVESYVSMRSKTDETDKILMTKKSNYIENYNVVDVYTKPGYIDNSFIAYVHYEVKFKDFETTAPGMNTLYLCTDEEGNLFVESGEKDADTEKYMETVSAEEDVADLFNRIQVNYNDVVDSDEGLKAFLEDLAVNLKNEVGEELALLAYNQPEETGEGTVPGTEPGDTQEATTGEDSQNNQDDPQEGANDQPGTENNQGTEADKKESVCTNDRVNMRAEANSDSAKVDVVPKGTTLTRLENLASGWSKVVYEGKEGYIRSDLLTVVETPKGYVKTTDKVNVRTEPNTEGNNKMGVASSGTILGLLEHRSDGWSRVIYDGKSGYIKTEFLEDVAE
ncbi:MAG: SH3 domain-containing protein [Lachnospiraceae bacterium]|nr:SH3 domain-containing protein [Candidatus Merdinaster equi]